MCVLNRVVQYCRLQHPHIGYACSCEKVRNGDGVVDTVVSTSSLDESINRRTMEFGLDPSSVDKNVSIISHYFTSVSASLSSPQPTCAAKSIVRNRTAKSPMPPPISTVTPSLPPLQTSSRNSPLTITLSGRLRGGEGEPCSGVCIVGGVAISVRSMAEPGVLDGKGREWGRRRRCSEGSWVFEGSVEGRAIGDMVK